MRSLQLVLIKLLLAAFLFLPAGACRGQQSQGQRTQDESVVLLSKSSYGALVERLSGSPGYFDTDNLISNESSYLHAITTLDELGLQGGAYLGVGPDQNFSYIAHLQPSIAFILDIRRDNLLLHLLYKVLFEKSGNRAAFLSNLFGRRHVEGVGDLDVSDLLDAVAASPALSLDKRESLQKDIMSRIGEMGISLSEEDLRQVLIFHDEFISKGPGLRFTSHGRPPQSYYPTYKELAIEQDRTGRRVGFLSEEPRFQYIKGMHESNLIIPVVGNFADPHALREIATYLEEIDEQVIAFYTSNVEFYLMYQQQFHRFAENVALLPAREDAVMIRSYFNRFRRAHPETMPGYASTQLVQYMKSMVAHPDASYGDLVSDYIR